jgi:cytoskeleton protein RodZ
MNDELTPEPGSSEPHRVPVPAASVEASGPAGSETLPAEPDGPPTAGGIIRAARHAQSIDLASLAAMLKIPLRRLEALEQGRHDQLQGPTFERALAQAACRVLKIDPKPVLALLPQHEGNTLERVTEGLNTPFRERQGSAGFGDGASLFRPVVIVPVLIVIAALALFYVPEGLWARLTHPVVAGGSTEAPVVATGTTTSTIALPLAASDAGSGAASAPETAPSAATAAASAAAPPPPAVVSATAAQDVDDVLAHVAAPTIPLQVIATADSWVEVVDAQGHSLLSRTVVAGESVGLDGALPMRLKIGNARATHVKLRGDNVDLAPWTRDNVARLELK